MSANDPDDPREANNARLVYSLQKNVIDERSGRPIFSVNRTTGMIKTSLCCLDREHTALYGLLLTATDGGGLQGNIGLCISGSKFIFTLDLYNVKHTICIYNYAAETINYNAHTKYIC